MLVTLYDLPENWQFSVEGMAKILKDGVSSVKTTLSQLEKKGYLERRRNRTKKGWFSNEELYLKVPPAMANAPPGESPSVDFPPVVNCPVVSRPEEKRPVAKWGESNKHKSSNKEYKKKYIASFPRKNRFNNFEQRDYNYEQLEKALLAAQFARMESSSDENAQSCQTLMK